MDICSTPTEESVPPAASYTPQETTTTTKGVSRLREHVDYVMGDLVIGLAKSVVAGALKVQSAIEEANKLPQSAQRDLVFITGEFQMLHSFLSVADEERVKNIVVKTWVRQMRELAYDLEDCIEFVVNMDMKLPYWVRLLPPFMDFPRPQDMVADEIEQLRARVQDVSMRNSRYSLISDSGSKPVLAQQQPAARADTRRQHVLGDLTQLITKKEVPDLQVISVWGAGGGIGTTSVIRKAYSDPEISYNFTCRAWVNITHPFNPQEFVRSLMAHFYANRYKERPGTIIGIDVLTSMNASTTKGDLLTDFVQLVDKTKYLVILEDVCTIAEWDSIRTFLPDRKNGSCIIVSSQQYEIASLCVGHPYQVLDLKQLPAEHSVCAFLREGSQDAGDESDANNNSTRNKEMSTKYDLSHDQRNGYSSFHRIPKSRKKAAIDWMHNSPLVGCRLKLNQLRSYIAQAQLNNSRVMSVWGIPGVGKSSLVRNLYYDQVLENQKFQEYSWVSLSHTQPFNLRDFSRRMLLDFQSESLRAKETVPARSMVGMENAVQKCRELLSTRRCLVIIDGLQSTEEWDSIQFSLVSRHSRSKTVIIVVTTEASVATYCADKEELVFNVKALEADAALDLLKNEVSKKTPFPASAALSSRENAVLHEIVPMCGGLPLLIVAMAGILATNVVGWMESASNINLGFMHELEINPEFESLWDLFSWMHSCFRTCPDSLKACMFSLSLFPRNHNIRRRRLVRRWIAEGYCRDSDNKSAEENGDEFFSKLLNLSLIQQPPQSDTAVFSEVRMVLCRVNGFLRECILSRGMEESHVIELAGSRIPTTQHSWRHLVISESWDRRIVLESIELSRLRSMTVFGNWQSFFISRSMKLLRVLDLEDAVGVTDDAVEDMVKLMPHLKFLSLRGCKEIFQLPRSLGRLRQLQTLDVTNTSIITLPETISKLQKLQYIRCGITATASKDPSEPHTSISLLSMFHRRHRPLIGVKVPSGIEKLTALHTLGIINIRASGREAIRKVLKNLTQLRKLGVFGVNFNNRQVFSSAISSYGHLGSLSVWLDKESRRCLNDICLPLKNIQSLKLYGLLDRLPVLQVDELSKLAKLHLEMDGLREQDIEILGKLPKLCILRLRVEFHEYDLLHFRVFYNGLELPSYQKLRVLDIACRSSLHVTFASLTMKKLELLKVDCSGGSSYQLSGLDHLSELREVCLNGSYEETLKQFLQGQLAHHPRKPELKLEEEMPRSST